MRKQNTVRTVQYRYVAFDVKVYGTRNLARKLHSASRACHGERAKTVQHSSSRSHTRVRAIRSKLRFSRQKAADQTVFGFLFGFRPVCFTAVALEVLDDNGSTVFGANQNQYRKTGMTENSDATTRENVFKKYVLGSAGVFRSLDDTLNVFFESHRPVNDLSSRRIRSTGPRYDIVAVSIIDRRPCRVGAYDTPCRCRDGLLAAEKTSLPSRVRPRYHDIIVPSLRR